MYILGISAYYHDSAACLVKDGKVLAAAEEERFTRLKHDASFPSNAIDFCLASNSIKIDDVELVCFYDKPFLKFERILQTALHYAPRGIRSFVKSIPVWLNDKIWIKDSIVSSLQYNGKIIFPEHHKSHAASAFFASPYQKAAFLTVDGVGEWATTSYGIGNDNNVEIVSQMNFPHSLGLLYSAFTYYIGFKVNSGEYKVMGLAPYGKPKYKNLILSELMDLKEDGSFKLNMKYFDYCMALRMTNKRFEKLFSGKPRIPESAITQREMDLAASIQEVVNEVMLRMARHVREETGLANLCLAGGVCLNCVANSKLLFSKIFDSIWIQPAAGDAGAALGSALFGWYQYLGNGRIADNKSDFQSGSYLGPEFSDVEIRTYLEENKIEFKQLNDDKLLETVSDFIAQGKVIGWFQGKMEYGPRALGNRSIIADARSTKMQEILNLKIKFRESFRPFAPSVLAEHANEYFDIDCESPYMLLVAPVVDSIRKEVSLDDESLFGVDKLNVIRSFLPAVTHVDYSARIQTVDGKYNKRYYSLIKKFHEKYKTPVIINTSFNVRGEPIVCNPHDAFQCFMKTDMDYLVMGNFVLSKEIKND